jgi:hypothetical protein
LVVFGSGAGRRLARNWFLSNIWLGLVGFGWLTGFGFGSGFFGFGFGWLAWLWLAVGFGWLLVVRKRGPGDGQQGPEFVLHLEVMMKHLHGH